MTKHEAQKLARKCGVWSAARHLNKQGYPLYMALHLLARKG